MDIQDHGDGEIYSLNVSPDEDTQDQTGSPTSGDGTSDNTSLPEKFKSGEHLVKAYTELEKKLGTPSQAPTSGNSQGDPLGIPEAPTPKPGLDFTKYQQEYQSEGSLSEASYQELATAGLDKGFVDSYIAGQLALAKTFTDTAYQAAGGAEEYKTLVSWAATALTPAERNAFNQATRGTPEQLALAVEGLKARYQRVNGSPPSNLINGSAQAASSIEGFASSAQLVEAMSNPKYQTDPAYRKQVEARLMVSNF